MGQEVILWLPVVLTVIALLLAVFYQDTGVMAKVNDILSGRLANAAEAWQKYGLSLLGQPITWTGQGNHLQAQHALSVRGLFLSDHSAQLWPDLPASGALLVPEGHPEPVSPS